MDALVVVVAEYDDTLAGFGGGVCLGSERVGVGVPAGHLARLFHPFRLRVDLVADVACDLDGEVSSGCGNTVLVLVNGEDDVGGALSYLDGCAGFPVGGLDGDRGGALRDGSVLLGGDSNLSIAATVGFIQLRPRCA